jgi:hypothetical protein
MGNAGYESDTHIVEHSVLKRKGILTHAEIKVSLPGHQWLTPIILIIWETEIRRIVVPGQPRQKVCKTPSHLNG